MQSIKVFIAACLFFSLAIVSAQDRGEVIRTHKYKTVYQQKEFLQHFSAEAGYMSNLITNPGFLIQLESPYKIRTKEINRFRTIRHLGINFKERQKTIRYDFLLGSKAGFVYNNQDHNNLLFELNSTLRRTGRHRIQRSAMVGLAYNLQFYNGPVYEVENGKLERKYLANRGYAMPVLGLGLGYELKNKSTVNLSTNIYIATRAPNGATWAAFNLTFRTPLNFKIK
jgi:hypothetical protein